MAEKIIKRRVTEEWLQPDANEEAVYDVDSEDDTDEVDDADDADDVDEPEEKPKRRKR